MQTPKNFTLGIVTKPRPTTGALSTSVSDQSTDMERDITNAVNATFQQYWQSRSLLRVSYNYLMLTCLQLQSLYSPQQVFRTLTYALSSLMTLLILYVFCAHTNVKTATNIDSSLTVLTTLAMSLSRLCLLQLCLQMDTEQSLLPEQLTMLNNCCELLFCM